MSGSSGKMKTVCWSQGKYILHFPTQGGGGVQRVPWNGFWKSLATLIEQTQYSLEEQCSKLAIYVVINIASW